MFFPKFSRQCDKSYRSQIDTAAVAREINKPILVLFFFFFSGTSFGTGNSNLFARV